MKTFEFLISCLKCACDIINNTQRKLDVIWRKKAQCLFCFEQIPQIFSHVDEKHRRIMKEWKMILKGKIFQS